jgi:integrase
MGNELVPIRSQIEPRAKRPAVLRRPLGAQVEATLQAAARGDHTARSYRQAIGLFLTYVGGVLGRELASVTIEGRKHLWAFAGTVSVLQHIEPGHLAGYRAWRESEGDGPNTASQRYAAVVTVLSVCYRDGILADEQALAMGIRPYIQRQKRDRRPVGRRLDKGEVRALQAAPDVSTAKGKRDLAILGVMLYAGLRCDEVARLTLANLKQDRGRWWIVFSGKGQKTRRVKVHDTLFESLAAWLAVRGLELGKGEAPVFVSVNKGDAISSVPVNTATVNRLVAEYGALAELAPATGANRLSPHDLRRTCARNAFDNGAPLPLIQAMLGHSSIDTTMTYIGASDDEGGGAVDFVRYQ